MGEDIQVVIEKNTASENSNKASNTPGSENIEIKYEEDKTNLTATQENSKIAEDGYNQKKDSDTKLTEENQPKEGSYRFNQIYGRWKESERNNEKLIDEINNLKLMVSNLSQNQESQHISDKIENLSNQFQEAIDNGDSAKAANLHRKMIELEVSRKESAKNNNQNGEKNIPKENKAEPQNIENAIAATIFTQSNPWYAKNAALRGAMDAYLIEVNQEPQFMDSPINIQINEAFSRLKAEFPNKFGAKKPPAAVGSVGNGSPQKSSAVITLTPDMRKVARACFSNKSEQEAYKLYALSIKEQQNG